MESTNQFIQFMFFSFLISYTVDRTPWTGDQPVARPLPAHRIEQTQNKRTQASVSQVGFEPTIPEFERAKIVHALDGAVTVVGFRQLCKPKISTPLYIFYSFTKVHICPNILTCRFGAFAKKKGKVNVSLYQVVGVYTVVRRRGFHIF
jgi:hypothetical protein